MLGPLQASKFFHQLCVGIEATFEGHGLVRPAVEGSPYAASPHMADELLKLIPLLNQSHRGPRVDALLGSIDTSDPLLLGSLIQSSADVDDKRQLLGRLWGSDGAGGGGRGRELLPLKDGSGRIGG